MDVEGAEWAFLRDSMTDVRSLDHVEQFVVEIHSVARFGTWRDIIRQRSLMLHYLEKRDFVLLNLFLIDETGFPNCSCQI
ncbi:hypothetical protein BV898_17095 [Hypsibius exemplaris]|uniref:Methyltransferase FkbM domain-containing protein n=1 Tax=Hypsibius exemplaris TaxID=2072580 RepID=A0A9X6NGL3_HYPEX|nr:hypothetical protein BV898_17095 [Hypsibius exemplaris]